jgi:hypothetical protein
MTLGTHPLLSQLILNKLSQLLHNKYSQLIHNKFCQLLQNKFTLMLTRMTESHMELGHQHSVSIDFMILRLVNFNTHPLKSKEVQQDSEPQQDPEASI